MKKATILAFTILVTLIVIGLTSCTANQNARTYGGKETKELKPNEKLLMITWKDSDMWMLTEDTVTHIQYFRESSSYGIWEGEIIITKPVISSGIDSILH